MQNLKIKIRGSSVVFTELLSKVGYSSNNSSILDRSTSKLKISIPKNRLVSRKKLFGFANMNVLLAKTKPAQPQDKISGRKMI